MNNCLHIGPTFGQSILDILLRFRVHPIALAGDIEKAFLMVSVTKRDQDVLRFLWVDDVFKESPEVVTMQFKRVVFGVSSSPFLLNGTIKRHMEQYRSVNSGHVEKFLRSMYVDAVTFGGKGVDETYNLYLFSKTRLAEGGFNLRKFVTNSPELRRRITDHVSCLENDAVKPTVVEEDESYAKNALGSKQEVLTGEQKILGIHWNFMEDTLKFDLSYIAGSVEGLSPTKSSVVSMATRFYDPLGVVSPCTVQFKVLFQQLYEAKLDWDEPMSGELLKKWEKPIDGLKMAQPIIIPRCYFSGIKEEVLSSTLQGTELKPPRNLCWMTRSSAHGRHSLVFFLMMTEFGGAGSDWGMQTYRSPPNIPFY